MIGRKLRQAAFALGLNVTKQTDVELVRALVRSLAPMDCGRPLIRIGGAGDGGYLVPDDLEGVEYCFSPGVSTVADFESHLADLGIRSFLADYSVDAPPIQRPEFVFDKKFLGAKDDEISITLESWVRKYLADSRSASLLQMDIEGSEYEVLLSAPRNLLCGFRIMVIEFHHLDRLFDPFAFTLLRAVFDKLLADFHVAHVHPNNVERSVKRGGVEVPEVVEITFYNRNRAASATPRRDLPHPLDRDNAPEKPALPLPPSWLR
jgi:hypothetical protein